MARILQFLAIITSVLVLINISFFEITLGISYYLILATVLFILLIRRNKIKLNPLMIWIISAGFISILLNDIPAFFNPYSRLLIFILVLLLVSPVISSRLLIKFRTKLFSFLNIFILIMTVGSAIGLIAGVDLVKEGRPDFTGLFTHSMVLGPMAGISMLYAGFLFYKVKNKFIKFLIFIAISLSFLTCIAAGSRSALLATLLGILFFIFKIYQERINKSIRMVFILISLMILSYPLWEKQSEFLLAKMEYGQSESDILASRSILWKDRVLEFNSSPIIGIGFSSVDVNLNNNFEKSEGKIEPGSSWLVVLSMTGVLGFIPLILIFWNYFRFIYNFKKNNLQLTLLGSLLVLFTVHLFFEGYIFSAGSGMFFYLWLLIGVADISKRKSVSIIKIIQSKKHDALYPEIFSRSYFK
jgi:O-antigen ligase